MAALTEHRIVSLRIILSNGLARWANPASERGGVLRTRAGEAGRRASQQAPERTAEPKARPPATALLDLDFGALLLERGLDLLGLVARDTLLDRLREGVDEVLGLLEAQARELANDLDDRDLGRPDVQERGGELGLLPGRGGGRGRTAPGPGRWRRPPHAGGKADRRLFRVRL